MKPLSSCPKEITVFIHGSLFSGFSFLRPFRLYRDRLSDDYSFRKMHKILRGHPLLKEQQLLLDEGMTHITQENIEAFRTGTLSNEQKRYAAYCVVSSYAMIESSYRSSEPREYYLFGWNGILSDRSRKSAAHSLYKKLCELRAKYGSRLQINLVTHSHGGNVALYLAYWEAIYKYKLSVQSLSLYGTPIQPETATFIFSRFFNAIFNFYSLGDRVQRADIVSVKSHKCFRTLGDCRPDIKKIKGLQRADILLSFNMWPRSFNHSHLFLLGRSQKIITSIDPLPIVVINSAFIEECYKFRAGYHELLLSINEAVASKQLEFTLSSASAKQQHCSKPLFSTLSAVVQMTKKNWLPTCASRNRIFSTQHTLITFDALKYLIYN